MKKKRFLKLVMSYGIQRDKAARMAARVGEFGSYEALFSFLRPSLEFWQMGAAARMAGRTIRQADRAFGDMTPYKILALFRIHREFNPDRFKPEEKEADIDDVLGGL